jgi:hypothetical protein
MTLAGSALQRGRSVAARQVVGVQVPWSLPVRWSREAQVRVQVVRGALARAWMSREQLQRVARLARSEQVPRARALQGQQAGAWPAPGLGLLGEM